MLPGHHIAFGPVPSRRLGQSLGINNAATKACSYTCVYCQVGPTSEKIVEPGPVFTSTKIHEALRKRNSASATCARCCILDLEVNSEKTEPIPFV